MSFIKKFLFRKILFKVKKYQKYGLLLKTLKKNINNVKMKYTKILLQKMKKISNRILSCYKLKIISNKIFKREKK